MVSWVWSGFTSGAAVGTARARLRTRVDVKGERRLSSPARGAGIERRCGGARTFVFDLHPKRRRSMSLRRGVLKVKALYAASTVVGAQAKDSRRSQFG